MSEKFNPADYLRTLTRKRKVKDARGQEQWVEEQHQYLDVKYRLLWFRQIYPEGYVDTVEVTVNERLARIEAVVYDRDGGKKLGKGRRQVMAADFRDYVEKAETQAIGRALAVAGFGTQFCDELDEGDSVADSPVTEKQRKPDQPAGNDPNLLYKVASQKGLSKDDTNLIIHFKYNKDSASQLTDEEYTEMVNGIKDTAKERLQDFLAKFKASMEESVA